MAPRPSSIAAWDSLIEERISQAYREGQFDNLNGSGQPLDASGAPMKAKSTDAEHKLNPFIDRTEFFLNRIVKSQGYAPPWVEIAKEIDADIATMRSELRSMYREARKPFRETTELQRSVRERGRQQPITARSSDNGNDEVTVHARSRFWSIMRQLLPDTPPPFPPDRRASTPPGTAPTSAPTSLAFHDINARMLSWAETRSRLIDAKIDRYNMSTPSGFGHRQRVLVDREIRNAIADVMKEEEAGEEMVAWKS
ncbi:uncharacterized protein EV422DRAFT_109376 [Fimicolochytrium jonesii]|uniref:uncharacterized protein n=1 Tax=Fimicolochytrium jonesii TaxID=1396493 RepID=UPI0022FF27F6|nr:uncharacterized protein EV422DRAFT_109376 [Fimicolochytrium jonesii]KAI8819359.1 hypothetical protein EV422DRAFT_109376 [Fimicolochytrium jonesii]